MRPAEANILYPRRGQLKLKIHYTDKATHDTKFDYRFRIYCVLYQQGDRLPTTGKELRESHFTREKGRLTFYTHTFPDTTSRTIAIEGQNIAHLDCGELQLTALDMTKNTALTTFLV